MVAFPGAIPVTTPELLTVATEEFVVVHVTVLSEAFPGDIVAVKDTVAPTFMDADVLFRLTDVTSI
jgi:hypothetical protein